MPHLARLLATAAGVESVELQGCKLDQPVLQLLYSCAGMNPYRRVRIMLNGVEQHLGSLNSMTVGSEDSELGGDTGTGVGATTSTCQRFLETDPLLGGEGGGEEVNYVACLDLSPVATSLLSFVEQVGTRADGAELNAAELNTGNTHTVCGHL